MTIDAKELKSARKLGVEVDIDLRAHGRIVARTFEEEPRYDIATSQGVLCNVPESALRDSLTVAEGPSKDEALISSASEELSSGDEDALPASGPLTIGLR